MTTFLERTPLRTLFELPPALIDQARSLAYQCHRHGRPQQAAILCRGLIAADHRYWWSYSLYAATLRRLGRARDALALLDIGLTYEPDAPKLLLMRSELRKEIANEERGETPAGGAVAETNDNNPSHAAA